MSDYQEITLPNLIETVTAPITDGRFTLYSASNFPDLPRMEWMIENVVPRYGLGVIFGPSGVGKSFLCLDLVTAVAGGETWFGHKTQFGQVVYIVLEGHSGFRRRVKAIEIHRKAPYSKMVKFMFDSFDITELENPLSLGKLISDEGGADLIVIDTLNRASPGADENSSSAMGDVIQGAAALQKMTGAMVLFVHHPGKDATRGLRGHSSLFAAMDTVIEVIPDGQLIRWRLAKSKDSDDKISHAFKLLPVELSKDPSGNVTTSCVIQEVEGAPPAAQTANEPTGANQQVILKAVKGLILEQRMQSVMDAPELSDGFPAGIPFDDVLSALKDTLAWVNSKHRQSRTKEALAALIRMGYLTQTENLINLPSN